MDGKKFETRIMAMIIACIPIQKINIKPIKLIQHRGCFYKVKTETDAAVFIRHKKWMFCLCGLNEIPKTTKKREYNYHIRNKKQTKETIDKKKILKQRIELANEAIKSVKAIINVERERV